LLVGYSDDCFGCAICMKRYSYIANTVTLLTPQWQRVISLLWDMSWMNNS
jgi:hypothetical protein